MKKVLVITYYWPPAGGGGVQRVVKFCKYLAGRGWEPVVLTVEDGNFDISDESLIAEASGLHAVYRAPSLEPHAAFRKFSRLWQPRGRATRRGGDSTAPQPSVRRFGEYVRLNLFIPDSRIGWRRRAVRRAIEIVAEEKPEVIFSTAPPYTAHLVAMEVKKRCRLPWVADFRDPWLENHAYNTVPRLALVKKINYRLERRVLECADRVLCANPGIVKLTSTKLSPSAAGKFAVITNGFDRDDVRPEVKASSRFIFSYFGTIYPNSFPVKIFDVLRELIDSEPGFGRDFLFRARGSISPKIAALIDRIIPAENREVGGYIPHKKMLDLLYEDQLLGLVINDFPVNFATVPGKIYEYLPTGNPILGLGPPGGDAAAILRRTGAGVMLAPSDTGAMKRFVMEKYQAWKRAGGKRPPVDFEEFERRNLAGQLAGIFDSLVPAVSR